MGTAHIPTVRLVECKISCCCSRKGKCFFLKMFRRLADDWRWLSAEQMIWKVDAPEDAYRQLPFGANRLNLFLLFHFLHFTFHLRAPFVVRGGHRSGRFCCFDQSKAASPVTDCRLIEKQSANNRLVSPFNLKGAGQNVSSLHRNFCPHFLSNFKTGYINRWISKCSTNFLLSAKGHDEAVDLRLTKTEGISAKFHHFLVACKGICGRTLVLMELGLIHDRWGFKRSIDWCLNQ